MPEEVGPHLLGRKPSPQDSRDFKLAAFMTSNPLDDALAALMKSRTSGATKAWANVITQHIKALEGGTPSPPSPSAITWGSNEVLDQGQTGHCVGFGWAGWGISLPVLDAFQNPDGHAIYYECKVIDGEPKAEDGSYVRTGAKAMLARSRLSAYAFAASVDEGVQWVRTHGPVVLGTDWYDDMFNPDPKTGLVTPTGSVAGGHCFLWLGHEPKGTGPVDDDVALCLNSWGAGWGQGGRFRIKTSDLVKLLDADGEACAAAELSL